MKPGVRSNTSTTRCNQTKKGCTDRTKHPASSKEHHKGTSQLGFNNQKEPKITELYNTSVLGTIWEPKWNQIKGQKQPELSRVPQIGVNRSAQKRQLGTSHPNAGTLDSMTSQTTPALLAEKRLQLKVNLIGLCHS